MNHAKTCAVVAATLLAVGSVLIDDLFYRIVCTTGAVFMAYVSGSDLA